MELEAGVEKLDLSVEVGRLNSFVGKLERLPEEQICFLEQIKVGDIDDLKYFNDCLILIARFKKISQKTLDILIAIHQSAVAKLFIANGVKSVYSVFYKFLENFASNAYLLRELVVYRMFRSLFGKEGAYSAIAKFCQPDSEASVFEMVTKTGKINRFIWLIQEFCCNDQEGKKRIRILIENIARGQIDAPRANLKIFTDKFDNIFTVQVNYIQFVQECVTQIKKYGMIAYPLTEISDCVYYLINCGVSGSVIDQLLQKFMIVCASELIKDKKQYISTLIEFMKCLREFSVLSMQTFSVIDVLIAAGDEDLVGDFILCVRRIHEAKIALTEDIVFDLALMYRAPLGNAFAEAVVDVSRAEPAVQINNNIFQLFISFIISMEKEKYKHESILNNNTIQVLITIFILWKDDDRDGILIIEKFKNNKIIFLELIDYFFPGYTTDSRDKRGHILSEHFADRIIANLRYVIIIGLLQKINISSKMAGEYFKKNSIHNFMRAICY